MENFLPTLALFKLGAWELGFNDPSLIGWITVILYLISTAFAIVCAVKVSQTREKKARWFWWTLVFILVFLGVNKQLDIQTLLISSGKAASWKLGFYEKRRLLQKGFMLTIGILSLIFFVFTGKALGQEWKKCKLAIIGLLFLCSFILLRGLTFNFKYRANQLLDSHYQWIVEIIGIILIMISAWLNMRRYKSLS